ncbi:MAG: hypothetical protein AAGG01_03040 [Planctomycetota bacterium]
MTQSAAMEPAHPTRICRGLWLGLSTLLILAGSCSSRSSPGQPSAGSGEGETGLAQLDIGPLEAGVDPDAALIACTPVNQQEHDTIWVPAALIRSPASGAAVVFEDVRFEQSPDLHLVRIDAWNVSTPDSGPTAGPPAFGLPIASSDIETARTWYQAVEFPARVDLDDGEQILLLLEFRLDKLDNSDTSVRHVAVTGVDYTVAGEPFMVPTSVEYFVDPWSPPGDGAACEAALEGK